MQTTIHVNNVTHTLVCGSYTTLTGVQADLIVTSPPYNIGSKGPARNGIRNDALGLHNPRDFGGISEYPDSLPEDAYQQSQIDFLAWAAKAIKPGGTIAYNHKNRRRKGVLISPYAWLHRCPELVAADEIVWDRKSTHNHATSHFWQHTERIYILKRKHESAKHYFNNSNCGYGADNRCDVWRIAPQRSWHNAAFPLEIPLHLIRKFCPPGGLVCDPYSGSGTARVAAMQLKCSFIGSELMPAFYQRDAGEMQRYADEIQRDWAITLTRQNENKTETNRQSCAA